MPRFLVTLAVGLAWALPAGAAGYHDDRALEEALRAIRADGFELTEFARDAGGAPIWMMQAGSRDPNDPAVLVVAGLDGRHVVGTEVALGILQRLAAAPDSALERCGLYVLPRLNPYGASRFFGPLRAETAGTAGSSDADRDGLADEDRGDDLDGDGMLTRVRVADPDGAHVLDGGGDFLRERKADSWERGGWLVLGEGRDDDGDERWNEEEDGGVNPARTFPVDYAWFARDAGPYPMSLPEVRALGDFLAATPRVAAVVVFGFEDNLLNPPPKDKTSNPDIRGSRFGRRPVDLPNQADMPLIQELGRLYRDALGLPEKAKDLEAAVPAAEAARGGLAAYAYYARGRLALATPVWTPGTALALAAAADTAGEKTEAPGDKDLDAGVRRDRDFRDWLLVRAPEAWLGWRDVEHPDFPGQAAQAGGFAPFARLAPPASELDGLIDAHAAWLGEVMERMPRVRIRDASLAARGGGVYEAVFTVENRGYLPDVLAQGVLATHARATRVEFDVPGGGEVLGAPPRFTLDRLEGSGGRAEVRRLVRLPGSTLTVRVVSEMGGSDSVTLRAGDGR